MLLRSHPGLALDVIKTLDFPSGARYAHRMIPESVKVRKIPTCTQAREQDTSASQLDQRQLDLRLLASVAEKRSSAPMRCIWNTSSPLRAPKLVSSLSLAERASRVFLASYFLR